MNKFKLFDLTEDQIAMISDDGTTVYFDIEDVKISIVDDSFTHEFGTHVEWHKEVECNLVYSCVEDWYPTPCEKLSDCIQEAREAAYDYLNEMDTNMIEMVFE